jgi:hypothetical protein
MPDIDAEDIGNPLSIKEYLEAKKKNEEIERD